MTTSTYEEDWYAGEWFIEEEYFEYDSARSPLPIDLIVLAVVAVVIAGLVSLNRLVTIDPSRTITPSQSQDSEQDRAVEEAPSVPVAPPFTSTDPDAFIIPYDDYQLTQGPHGMSYGHYAIDIAAGDGAPVKSPINGFVSELYVDGIGNPTLVIENEVYEVTMLHGDYTVELGQEVALGELVGTESNKGNTRDMAGNSCRNRDCGYHTHLNVFDKQAGQNVNPLDLLSKPYAN